LFNAHGDVVERTSQNGTTLKRYDYDAFGVERNQEPLDYNPYRYCGEYYDREASTYYLRNRDYNPVCGRFTQEDPVFYGDNWYAYTNSNPINFIDPSGLLSFPLRSLVVTVIATGVTTVIRNTVINSGGSSNSKSSSSSGINNFTASYMDSSRNINDNPQTGVETAVSLGILGLFGLAILYEINKKIPGRPTSNPFNPSGWTSPASPPPDPNDPRNKRSDHAQQRADEGRGQIGAARSDAQNARSVDILRQNDGRWVVQGKNGRINIFETNGQHVTTFKNPHANTSARISNGQWSRPTSSELVEFARLFNNTKIGW